MMKRITQSLGTLLLLIGVAGQAFADCSGPQVLSAEQWLSPTAVARRC